MKRIFVLFAVLGLALAARADLVIQQQIVTPTYTTPATIKVKGTKVRVDMFNGQPQAMSTVVDLKTGDELMILHLQRMFVKASMPKPSGNSATNTRPIQVHATGKTQKLGSYDTELYTWSNPRGMTGIIWVAKNFPNFPQIKADLAVVDKSAPADSTPALSTLPGMAVKTQITGGGQTITATLLSATETPVDAASFQTPAGYREMPKPKPLPKVNASQKTAVK